MHSKLTLDLVFMFSLDKMQHLVTYP
jgi:hypothetical protein